MSKFLLFCRKARVFLKYRFLIYKFRLVGFLGKFIPYFKPMVEFTEDDIIRKFNHIITRHFVVYNNKDFSFSYSDSEDFSYVNKSCEILYKVVYKKSINFNLSIKVRNKKSIIRLSNIDSNININNIENASNDIFMFIQYFQDIEDIDFFKVYMDYAKEKK